MPQYSIMIATCRAKLMTTTDEKGYLQYTKSAVQGILIITT